MHINQAPSIPEIAPTNSSLLHPAAVNNDFELCSRIVQCPKNDVNQKCDSRNMTPLLLAVEKGHSKVVHILCTRDDLDLRAVDNMQNTAMHLAATKGCLRIYATLKEHKNCDLSLRNCRGNTPEEELQRLLLRKARFGMVEEMQALAQQCDSIDCAGKFCETPLHKACASAIDSFEKVQFLLSHDATQLSVSNRCGLLPAHVAASNKDSRVLKRILNSGVYIDVNATGGVQQMSMLHIASLTGCTENVRFLLNDPVINPNAVDSKGNTPLHLAYSKGHMQIVHLLSMHSEIQLDVKNNDGVVPREISC